MLKDAVASKEARRYTHAQRCYGIHGGLKDTRMLKDAMASLEDRRYTHAQRCYGIHGD